MKLNVDFGPLLWYIINMSNNADPLQSPENFFSYKVEDSGKIVIKLRGGRPTRIIKNKTTYTRKQKHKGDFNG